MNAQGDEDLERGAEVAESQEESKTKSDTKLGIPVVGNSSNVLLLYQLQTLRMQYWVNFFLSLFCLLFIGINIVLLILNAIDDEEMKFLFHMLEFWATFVFSLVDVFALVFAPKSLGAIFYRPIILKILVAASVCISFVPALLMTIDIDRFEFACHNTEYAADFTMAMVDMILFYSMVRTNAPLQKQSYLTLGIIVLTGLSSIIALVVYNVLREGAFGEQVAHFMEFTLNIMNAGMIFWFVSDNRFLLENWIFHMLGTPTDSSEDEEGRKVQ